MMKIRIYVYLSLLVFSLLSCSRPLSWKVETSTDGPFSYGPPTNVSFQLSSYNPGDDAKLTLTFDIKEGDLETHKAVITYPGQFTFNGFLALGPAGTQIGSYDVDFDFDGTSDFTIPVFAIDNNTAYADRDIFDGSFDTSVDSTMVYSNTGGNHVFTTTLPFGGDGFPSTITGPFSERLVAVMNSGIITNPAIPGTYNISATFTSVDPDTDGADDGVGDTPLTLNPSQSIVIVSAGDPLPDIKANGSDGSVTPTDTLSVTVALDPGSRSGDPADWWVAANVSGTSIIDGWYYFDLSTFGFVLAGASPTTLIVTQQSPLSNLTASEILNFSVSGLPSGTYTFYLAVDMNMNSILDFVELFFDVVEVVIP